MKKFQAIAILACAASLFAQEPAPELISCEAAFNEVKNVYPRDAAANSIYATVNARIVELNKVEKDKRGSEGYKAELKSCDLAVELLKTQLSNVALRKNLDSLTQKNFEVQKEISVVKDSLINRWSSDASRAKSLNSALNDERNRLEKLNREKAEREANLAAELAAKQKSIEEAQKALAQKDSLLAAQKAEAEKKLNALRSQTISVYKDARGTILSMSDILFETNSAKLMPALQLNLTEIAAILKTLLTDSKVTVEGHTDNTGTPEHNQKLSEQRASAVMQFLIERGVEKERLESVGYGLTKPVADNSTPEGKAKNRRVELVIKD
jgi:outer membrane protein OmpA-like peptidoglycan-associated protein